MAKQQQFIDLFAKYDEDKDGEINQQEFINIITDLEVPYQYPGTVSKVIRKLNYANPDNKTLNLEQAKEYYNSFETISKHQIWKARIGLLNKAEEIKQGLSENQGQKEESSAAPAAAPGMGTPTEQPDKNPQQAHINILIGQAQPVYTSEIDIQIEKQEGAQKVRPFVKLTVTSKTVERAKELETVFKQNVSSFFNILSEEQPDYADLLKEIHVNSMVNDTKTTFFITTTNEEVTQYIQVLGEFFELTFNMHLASRAHIRFEFDYDFERFIKEENSNFYDIFTRNCRLAIDLKLFNLLKAFRKLYKADLKENSYADKFDVLLIGSLLHLETVEGDFQFENSQIEEYEKESKEEIQELLGSWTQFSQSLTSAGMKVKQLLSLLDDTISLEFKGGEWKANVFLRLKNMNQIFLQEPKPSQQQPPQQNHLEKQNSKKALGLKKSSSKGSFKSKSQESLDEKTSVKSYDSKKGKKSPKLSKDLSEDSD